MSAFDEKKILENFKTMTVFFARWKAAGFSGRSSAVTQNKFKFVFWTFPVTHLLFAVTQILICGHSPSIPTAMSFRGKSQISRSRAQKSSPTYVNKTTWSRNLSTKARVFTGFWNHDWKVGGFRGRSSAVTQHKFKFLFCKFPVTHHQFFRPSMFFRGQ